jgi:hypothetical protein
MMYPRAAAAALICPLLACGPGAEPPRHESGPPQEALASSDLDERWPGGTIHYNFFDSWDDEEHVPQATRDTFQLATAYIEARTPIKFEQVWTTDGDYLMVRREPDEPYSHAEIGFQGGETEIWLRDGVGLLGVVHELGHTLGLAHEHQRPDRDNFVTIVWANVIDDREEDDFETKDSDDYQELTPYDYHSMMHYGAQSACIQTFDPTQNPPAFCATTTSLTEQGMVTTNNTILPALGADTAPLIQGVQTELGVNNDMTKHDINAIWLMYARPLSVPVVGEAFGSALVIADFDRDGYNDLAIGAPEEVYGEGLGAVFLYKGTERRAVPWRRLVHGPTTTTTNRFGEALAVGDFDGDGFPDLAVGAPNAGTAAGIAAGTVSLFRGGQFMNANYQPGNQAQLDACGAPCASTSWPPLSPWMTLSAASIPGVTEQPGDKFGAAVAAADADADGFDELFVGAPVATGLGAAFWIRGTSLVSGSIEGGSLSTTSLSPYRFLYGATMASGDFDGDGKADLAVGAPGSREQVFIFCGAGGRRMMEPGQVLTSPTGPDEFGAALATGDLYGTIATGDALVVGAPSKVTPAGVQSGTVYVYGQRPGPPNCSVHLLQTIDGSASEIERFGDAVGVADMDLDGDGDLLAGAPAGSAGAGRVKVFRNSGISLVSAAPLATPQGAVGFGSSFAVGSVKHDPIPFVPDPLAQQSPRVFVGGPNADEEIFGVPFASGAVWGFSADGSGSLLRSKLGQADTSPF